MAFLAEEFSGQLPLKGKKALVTAGPTHEAMDPVRFIGNHSSGKMGFALAEALAEKGAKVSLVCGPNSLSLKNKSIKRIDVVSADEMFAAAKKEFKEAAITVLAAAVADYKPGKISDKKIKKSGKELTLELVHTPDIAMELGKLKKKGQFIAGFALETDHELENAKLKLEKKNFDMIVLNSLRDEGAGFGHDTNRVKIIERGNKTINFELKSKTEVAQDIVAHIVSRLK
jgi:phosphopantothenoylcysteine decarboxylase/phosphopantothenate--cysteine ligase